MTTPVHFADGFDRPDTIALGLEAPQMALIAGGAATAWLTLHSVPGPSGLLLAALLAVVSGAAGAGRWAGRPVLTWAWLAARFALRPRSGGGVLLAAGDDRGSTDVSSRPWDGTADGVPSTSGAPGGSEGSMSPARGGGGPAGGSTPGPNPGRPPRPEDEEPAWARWLRDGGRRSTPAPGSAPPDEPSAPAHQPAGSPAFRFVVEPEEDLPPGPVTPPDGLDAGSTDPPPRAAAHRAGTGDPVGGDPFAPAGAAVDQWLAHLSGGGAPGLGAAANPHSGSAAGHTAGTGTARPATLGDVRDPERPDRATAPGAGQAVPSRDLLRRLLAGLRGRPTPAAPHDRPAHTPQTAGPAVTSAAPPGAGQPPTAPRDPRMVELDRPPLVLLPALSPPAAAPQTAGVPSSPPVDPAVAPTDGRGGSEPADGGASDDDEEESEVVGRVIHLHPRPESELDEELMLELADESAGGRTLAEAPVPPGESGSGGSAGPPGGPPPPPNVPVFVGATRRICFWSLNGGTGRTMLATEVASLLAARGLHAAQPDQAPRRLRVGLVDLDLRSSNVAVRLGIAQPTLWDYLLATGEEADDVSRFMVDHPSGLRALLGPPKPLSTATAAVDPARVAEIVHQLERDGFHFLVFDLGSDLGPVATWVLSAVHDIYVVLSGNARGIQDAYRTTEALRRLGVGHKLRYVVNQDDGSLDVGEVMGDLGGRVVARIPRDRRFEEAENTHRLASLSAAGGPGAEAVARLASTIYPAMGGPRRRRLWRGRRVG